MPKMSQKITSGGEAPRACQNKVSYKRYERCVSQAGFPVSDATGDSGLRERTHFVAKVFSNITAKKEMREHKTDLSSEDGRDRLRLVKYDDGSGIEPPRVNC